MNTGAGQAYFVLTLLKDTVPTVTTVTITQAQSKHNFVIWDGKARGGSPGLQHQNAMQPIGNEGMAEVHGNRKLPHTCK